MPEYFIILLFFLAVTIGLYVRFRPKIYKSTGHMIAINVFIVVVASVWDEFAIFRGHWRFGEEFLLGPKLWYMPIEELGFMVIMWHFFIIVYKIIETRVTIARR